MDTKPKYSQTPAFIAKKIAKFIKLWKQKSTDIKAEIEKL